VVIVIFSVISLLTSKFSQSTLMMRSNQLSILLAAGGVAAQVTTSFWSPGTINGSGSGDLEGSIINVSGGLTTLAVKATDAIGNNWSTYETLTVGPTYFGFVSTATEENFSLGCTVTSAVVSDTKIIPTCTVSIDNKELDSGPIVSTSLGASVYIYRVVISSGTEKLPQATGGAPAGEAPTAVPTTAVPTTTHSSGACRAARLRG